MLFFCLYAQPAVVCERVCACRVAVIFLVISHFTSTQNQNRSFCWCFASCLILQTCFGTVRDSERDRDEEREGGRQGESLCVECAYFSFIFSIQKNSLTCGKCRRTRCSLIFDFLLIFFTSFRYVVVVAAVAVALVVVVTFEFLPFAFAGSFFRARAPEGNGDACCVIIFLFFFCFYCCCCCCSRCCFFSLFYL